MSTIQRDHARIPNDQLGFPSLERLVKKQERRRPRFSRFWVCANPPRGCELLAQYSVGDASVSVLRNPTELRYHYLLMPWEHIAPPELLRLASRVIDAISSRPPKIDLGDLGALRNAIADIARDEAIHLSSSAGVRLSSRDNSDLERLVHCVVRNTVGMGLFEVLLEDEHVEDVYVDAPSSSNPVHLALNGIAGKSSMIRATTNIISSDEELDGFVSRLRFQTGRPFSEAFPTLETDLGFMNARATVIGPPLSQAGLAFAIRRHSGKPWTLPRMVAAGTLDPFSAGLLSFLVDGRSTILFCGPRGAGKSALLSATLFEFPTSHRVLTIEDTPELPVKTMQALGFKVQSMVVEPALGEDAEAKSESALRVSLRLGESAIVVGEVRGREARVLYDSMRTGKAGSSVLGTIHGDSPSSVLDRVVHEMGISRQAFLATDIIVCLGLYRNKGSQTSERRLVQIVETPTGDDDDFNVLVAFDPATGRAVESMAAKSRIVAHIAASWNISYLEALQNIQARAELREILLDKSRRSGPEYLGAEWTCRANQFFWERVESGAAYHTIPNEFRRRVGA